MPPLPGSTEPLSPMDSQSLLTSAWIIVPDSCYMDQDGDHWRAYVLLLTASGFQEPLSVPGVEVEWGDDLFQGPNYLFRPQVTMSPIPRISYLSGTNMVQVILCLAFMQLVLSLSLGPDVSSQSRWELVFLSPPCAGLYLLYQMVMDWLGKEVPSTRPSPFPLASSPYFSFKILETGLWLQISDFAAAPSLLKSSTPSGLRPFPTDSVRVDHSSHCKVSVLLPAQSLLFILQACAEEFNPFLWNAVHLPSERPCVRSLRALPCSCTHWSWTVSGQPAAPERKSGRTCFGTYLLISSSHHLCCGCRGCPGKEALNLAPPQVFKVVDPPLT